VADGGGGSLRQASHPELPDCVARSPEIEATLGLLEQRRVEVIVTLLPQGVTPPIPRSPLLGVDTERLLLRNSLHSGLAPLLDRPEAQLTNLEGKDCYALS
jgi:hypothetical protein